ncbi:MAG: hypothetical protein P4L79_11055 [Legionella sp.]|uniref:hypothetical protein n=1 Tax=Legionella sp. TaxID=459 RepID=UPI0028515587|nr:hypothetical protein [Legionella sp.]
MAQFNTSNGSFVDSNKSITEVVILANTSGGFLSGGVGSVTNPSTIYSNTQVSTLSAAALPSQTLTNGIVLTTYANNTGVIYVGQAGVTNSTGYPLAAGQSISYGVTNLNAIYIVGTNTTDYIAFTGN